MRSFVAALSALALAAFVVSQPTVAPAELEPRCESCDEACPSTHFWYEQKKCCLETGGPKTIPKCPSTIGCPSDWYWHDAQKCCVPKNPNPSKPTCDTTTFPVWNGHKQCCEKPTPTGPGTSQTSPKPGGNYGNWDGDDKDGHKHRRAPVVIRKISKSRSESLCPKSLEVCPIVGVDGEQFECVDPVRDVRACGGCPSLGKGQDCTTIPGAHHVSCKRNNAISVSACFINTCQPGFIKSADGTSCISRLITSPQ